MSWSIILSQRYRIKPINAVRAEISEEKKRATYVLVDKNYEEMGFMRSLNAFGGRNESKM